MTSNKRASNLRRSSHIYTHTIERHPEEREIERDYLSFVTFTEQYSQLSIFLSDNSVLQMTKANIPTTSELSQMFLVKLLLNTLNHDYIIIQY